SHDLQSVRVAAHMMHGDTRNDLGISIVELHLRAVNQAHHRKYSLQIVGMRKERLGHVTTRRKRHLALLEMKTCTRKQVQIARVVVMQMRDYDVFDLRAIDAQQA